MSNVKIVKGNLFDAPKGSIICHAVNCMGVWGAGIAKTFKEKYPEAYRKYKNMCDHNGPSLIGSCLLIPANEHTIACLFTSVGYGYQADREEDILSATFEAVGDLIFQNKYPEEKPIHMCQINSGLFGVEWSKTQKELEFFVDQEFTVYEF